MRRALPLLVLLVAGCPADGEPPPAPSPGYAAVADVGPARAVGALGDGSLLVATRDRALLAADSTGATWNAVDPAGLAEGAVTWIGGADRSLDLAYVYGRGLHRSTDGGATWERVEEPPSLPLPGLLNPRADVVPFAVAADERGGTWLAGVGGLFRTLDGVDWTTMPVASSGSFNVLFTGIDTEGGDVWAVAQLADSMLPASFQGLLSGTVFHSPDFGETWEDRTEALPARALMGVDVLDGVPCVATLDRGVWCRDGGWAQVGGDFDAVAVRQGDELTAATASRGVWRWDEEAARWRRYGDGPQLGLAGSVAVGTDGVVRRAGPAVEDGPADAGGTVHVALSFHTNYYHSYRGDEPTDDGFGLDIDVIRTVLDWLDERPQVHADWDVDDYFTLDGWMATESPDIRLRIQERVAAGTDDVRLMSWNNGAVANHTRDEFDRAIGLAQASHEAAFSETVPGVQPQENMFTPDHIGWYRDLGVEWITLFYSANGFTGMRLETELAPHERYAPLTLVDEQSGAAMTWVPVYHHAEVLDHGGLAAWVRQISATVPGDSLLVVHFDADAESWELFDAELDDVQPLVDAGVAEWTNIQPFLDDHEPVSEVVALGDIADGTGDGFQSWAEKEINHEISTAVAVARDLAAAAAVRGDGDAGVAALVDAAIAPRLLALSTTHFGLAAPFLHADRQAAARAWAGASLDAGQAALDAAAALDPLAPGEVAVINHTDAAGPALVEIPVAVSGDVWTSPSELVLRDDAGDEQVAGVEVITIGGDVVTAVMRAVLDLPARSVVRLTWAYEPGHAPLVGGLTLDDAPADLPLVAPFTECDGLTGATALVPLETHVDGRGTTVATIDAGNLPLCDQFGTMSLTRRRIAGLPGTVVEVVAVLPELEDLEAAESIALSPLACPGVATTLRWDTYGGTVRERPMRPGTDTWNGQAAWSQVELVCAEGDAIRFAPRDRTSLAFAPVREVGGVATVAPLGTLYGVGEWHDGRSTGGSSLGEVATFLVGSQFRPAAPDWAGKTVTWRLLVAEPETPWDVLELWAHPPVVVSAAGAP